MSDDTPLPFEAHLAWVKSTPVQPRGDGDRLVREARALVDGLTTETLADPLHLAIGDLFQHFGFHATQDAIETALRHARQTVGLGPNGGRPPASLAAANKALRPFRRGRGKPSGGATENPDSLQLRDHLWLALWDLLKANEWGNEEITDYIVGLEDPTGSDADDRVRSKVVERLKTLRRRRCAGLAALTPGDLDW